MNFSRPPRLPRRAVHGVLLVDKPLGWTSNDVLQKVKHLLRAEKGGHTGTLDPLATGLLPLCFGAATKFSQVNLEADKSYLATIRLGVRTTTGDREGEVVATMPVTVTPERIAQAQHALTGPIRQIPPMHSALKKDGRALYEYARQGLEVDRPKRDVTVYHFDILECRGDEIDIAVDVSKGTYIRTLAEDFGALLGCGAHLTALRRVRSGPVDVSNAVTLDALVAMTEVERQACLQIPDVLVSDWPSICLGEEDASRFLCGLRRRVAHSDAPHVRVYGTDTGSLLGTARIQAGELIASRVLSPVEVQGLVGGQRPPVISVDPVKAAF